MKTSNISLVLALGGSLWIGCGDDEGGSPEQGNRDASTTDASVLDGATPKPDSGTVADAGAKDSSVTPSLDGGKSDASTDAGDAATSSSLLTSAACTSCASTECTYEKIMADPGEFTFCDDFPAADVAVTGPRMGMPRKTLCEAVGACMARTGCGNPIRTPAADGGLPHQSFLPCLCGSQDPDSCFANAMASDFKGPCVSEILGAAETTDIQTLFERIGDPKFGIGGAAKLYTCQTRVCADECFAPCAGQQDGVSCNAAYEEGNTAPSGTCAAQKCADSASLYTGG